MQQNISYNTRFQPEPIICNEGKTVSVKRKFAKQDSRIKNHDIKNENKHTQKKKTTKQNRQIIS